MMNRLTSADRIKLKYHLENAKKRYDFTIRDYTGAPDLAGSLPDKVIAEAQAKVAKAKADRNEVNALLAKL